jgi:hypothetical protein
MIHVDCRHKEAKVKEKKPALGMMLVLEGI